MISKFLIIFGTALYILGMMQRDLLNENQLIGSVWFSLLLFIASIIFFINGAIPFKKMIATDRKIKLGFYFAVACVVLSALQIPLWVFISGKFPPSDFSKMQALVVAIAVGLSAFGPASPWLIQFRRHLVDINHRKRKEKRHKQNKR